MEEFTSPMARCASLASAFSTICCSRPLSSRTMRPYARGSGGSKERTVAVAPERQWSSTSCCSSSGLRRGWSPDTTSSCAAPPTCSRAARSESPVPRGFGCTATFIPSNAWTASGATTSTSGSAPVGCTAATTQSTRRRPSSGCKCFGVADFIRVPRPAAMITAARSGIKLGRQDSNLGSRDQNPLPYHLATPHQIHGEERLGALSVVGEEVRESDQRKADDDHNRHQLQDEGKDDHEDREHLRRGCDPRELARDVPVEAPARNHVEGEHDDRESEDRPAAEVLRERCDEALHDRRPQRNLDAALTEPAARPGRSGLYRRLCIRHEINGTTL